MMENKTKIDLKNKSVFITGVAGFIGSNLAKRLLATVEDVKVVGLDNMNHYYDVRLKEARLNELEQFDNFSFVKGNLADKAVIESIFEQYKPEIVVNLGAQAGVRYSITNPDAYVEANLIGFYNILEACRHSYDEGHTPVEHLVYASSSSVYGSNKKVPYSTDDKVDNPVSLYAATKKSNELMAHVHVVNELDVPILCMGLKDIVVSASPGGILVSDKEQSSYIKPFVNMLDHRVMFAEESWGSFKVIDIDKESMTIKVTLNAGHRMNYHSHQHRDEVWTVIAGKGKTIVDGMEQNVKAGDVITMSAGCRHTVIAETELKLIEVQLGKEIDVNDKQKFELEY